MLCSTEYSTLTTGKQLRGMCLRSGLTLSEAAKIAEIGKRTLMNYELGRVKRMKPQVIERLIKIHMNE
ncbi:MAG: helix-turn-helix domain-containing protein [Oscillospiraceae bacterium]